MKKVNYELVRLQTNSQEIPNQSIVRFKTSFRSLFPTAVKFRGLGLLLCRKQATRNPAQPTSSWTPRYEIYHSVSLVTIDLSPCIQSGVHQCSSRAPPADESVFQLSVARVGVHLHQLKACSRVRVKKMSDTPP